jgi:hypothetical protein
LHPRQTAWQPEKIFRQTAPRKSTYQAILPIIFFISSTENARKVSDRTLPREQTLKDSAVAPSSSGASQTTTTSRLPSVQ